MPPQEYMNLPIDDVAKTKPPFVFISFPSKKDPNWSQHPGRESKSTCHIITMANWDNYKEFAGTPPDECGGKYREMESQYTKVLLEMLYKNYPQVEGHIEYMHCFTPLTNHHNLARMDGDSYGMHHGQELYSPILSIGAFPPSHFSNKLADKLAHKVASQTNVRHLCLVCQSEVCYKPNWFATNSPRQL
jgi:hypothetical protein